MNSLAKKLSKKTGLSTFEMDAMLKVIGYEIVENLKTHRRFNYEGLGVFFAVLTPAGLTIKLRLSPEAYERLNTIEGERSDEIILK
jgi:hypothetical protein